MLALFVTGCVAPQYVDSDVVKNTIFVLGAVILGILLVLVKRTYGATAFTIAIVVSAAAMAVSFGAAKPKTVVGKYWDAVTHHFAKGESDSTKKH